MGKRAPILPDNYNPVGERLQRLTQPPAVEPPGDNVIALPTTEPLPVVESGPTLREREPIPDIPTGPELKTVSVRFRCALSERKKWHELTRELSGDHNNLSHFIRAALLLVENAQEQLQRLAPDIQRFQKPATTDPLGLTIYEQRLAQLLYDAIKAAGRPKG
jgi:hypothetical protein